MAPRSIRTEFVKYTPKKAAELLETNAVNRRLRPRLVECYAEDMKAGLWRETGETIKISRTGQLQDGQHRLSAIIEAGVTVELLTVIGLPDEAQGLMDQGAARTATDALQLAGVANATLAGAVARWTLLGGVPGPGLEQALKKKASTAKIVKIVQENPDIEHAARAWHSLKTYIPGSPSAICYSWLHFHRVDAAACEEFFGAMVDMNFKALHDPRKAALRTLTRMDREEGITASSKDKALATTSVLTRAWNTWRKGEDVPSINVKHKGRLIPPVTPV